MKKPYHGYHGPEEPLPTRFERPFAIVPKHVLAAMPKIKSAGVAVYVAIAGYHADNETGKAWPGIRKIATETGLDPKTVMAAVERLEEAKLIRTEKKSRRLTIYWLCTAAYRYRTTQSCRVDLS